VIAKNQKLIGQKALDQHNLDVASGKAQREAQATLARVSVATAAAPLPDRIDPTDPAVAGWIIERLINPQNIIAIGPEFPALRVEVSTILRDRSLVRDIVTALGGEEEAARYLKPLTAAQLAQVEGTPIPSARTYIDSANYQRTQGGAVFNPEQFYGPSIDCAFLKYPGVTHTWSYDSPSGQITLTASANDRTETKVVETVESKAGPGFFAYRSAIAKAQPRAVSVGGTPEQEHELEKIAQAQAEKTARWHATLTVQHEAMRIEPHEMIAGYEIGSYDANAWVVLNIDTLCEFLLAPQAPEVTVTAAPTQTKEGK
jgi:hypothetical protein